MPTRSLNTTSEFEYDPWLDLDDNGIIDIYDVVWLNELYNAEGIPINKTELLYEVNATYTRLLSKIDSLNSSLLDLEAYLITRITTFETLVAQHQSEIEELESRIEQLETEIAILNATKLGKPDYDSFEEYGWYYLPPDAYKIFTHGLGTTNVLVYLVFLDNTTGNIHQWCYGGEVSGFWYGGAWWHDLTDFTITVSRYKEGTEWNYVRIMLWKIREP
jgi:hypothetical protein